MKKEIIVANNIDNIYDETNGPSIRSKEKNNFWIDHLFLTFICRQREKNKDAWLVNRCLSCNCHLYIPK